MGSHYIPVGKIKIDKDLLDLACPAAGYTPEIMCPAAGYILDTVPEYEEFLELPEPSEEEIILECEDIGERIIIFRTTLGGGGTVCVDIYDASNILQYSYTVNSNVTFSFDSEKNPISHYYYIKIYPQLAGKQITVFTRHGLTGYSYDYPILSAIFNTPNITSLASAFRDQSRFKKITFNCSLNYLTNLSYTFANAGITHFTFPASLPACNNITSMFHESALYYCDFNFCSMPLLTSNAQSVLRDTKNLRIVIFNPVFENITNMFYFFAGSGIRELDASPANFGSGTKTVSMNYWVQNCVNLQSLIWFDIPSTFTITLTSGIENCPSLKYLEIKGYFNFSGSYFLRYTTNIETFILDKYVSVIPWATTTLSKLKTLRLPDEWPGLNLALNSLSALEELDCPNCYSTGQVYLSCSQKILKKINLPNVYCYRINIGNTSNVLFKLNEVILDWGNGDPSNEVSPIYDINANLNSTQINAIFSALPEVTGRAIRVSSNPGFAASDPSIATAKGWGVI